MTGVRYPMTDFTDAQLQRYARHIILPELGGVGQAKLMNASVLVVGAGGLGAPLLLYLAAAGVGRIGVIDDDVVELSNLQRQVIHDTDKIGTAKVESAKAAVARVNPRGETRSAPPAADRRQCPRSHLALRPWSPTAATISPTRFLINDAAYFAKKPLVSAAILRFEGQLATFKAHDGKSPCYRCIFHEAPPAGLIPTCSEGGVLGAVAGALGSLQATEVLKELAGIGDSLAGSLLIYDALGTTFRKVKVKRDPGLPAVRRQRHDPTILSSHKHAAPADICAVP